MGDPKIPGGYILKARQIKDSYIAHAPPYVRELWDYLLREAAHAEHKYSGFILKRGQVFKSYKEIREDLCWYVGYRKERYNENHMKKGMKALKRELMITTMKEPRGVLITILNYDFFQEKKNYERTKDRTHERTTKEPMGNQSGPSINKNDKNVKNTDKTYSQTSDEIRLSQLLFKLIQERNPKAKQPNFQKWAVHVDRICRVDDRTPGEVDAVIRWCQQDSFWQNNILGTEKLRKQFDQLYLKMKSNGKPKPSGDWRQNQNIAAAKEFLSEGYNGPER